MTKQNKDRLLYNAREWVKRPRSSDDKYNYLSGILDTLEALGVSFGDYNEMESEIESILYPEPVESLDA